jgi:regulatory protein
LATISYFPGVIPPGAEPTPSTDVAEADTHGVIESLAGAIEKIIERPAQNQPTPSAERRSRRVENVSLHALARRGLSSHEMMDLLRARELSDDEIEGEVARLERAGLLDDVELASTLVRTLHERKGLGKSAIAAELRRRRVDVDAIESALSELDGDDELQRARELAVKRAPQLRSLDSETARRRLGAFLMRKGYSGSVVATAVGEALRSGAPTARGPRFE